MVVFYETYSRLFLRRAFSFLFITPAPQLVAFTWRRYAATMTGAQAHALFELVQVRLIFLILVNTSFFLSSYFSSFPSGIFLHSYPRFLFLPLYV
jgi:hypothetical protein